MILTRRAAMTAVPLMFAACAEAAAATVVQVVKSPSCGCCNGWVAHLRRAGLQISVTNVADVTPIARRLGVPDDLRSCHTASVGGYAIEGHVPAGDILRLLRQRPAAAAGLAVPGMPVGSPGMEQGGAREPYATILFRRDGRRHVFARH